MKRLSWVGLTYLGEPLKGPRFFLKKDLKQERDLKRGRFSPVALKMEGIMRRNEKGLPGAESSLPSRQPEDKTPALQLQRAEFCHGAE